jgi:hypothetical protein
VSSADSLLSTTSSPTTIVRTGTMCCGLSDGGALRWGYPGPRALAASSSGSLLRVDVTNHEKGSQTSGDSIEPLDFPNF